jgi:peptide-methionine (S)-S-oxide reductase
MVELEAAARATGATAATTDYLGFAVATHGNELAAFGMGCFWGGEALFGAVPGVKRTSVGFAGGSTPQPTYLHIGDHIETVLVEYDPDVVDYRSLIDVFWTGHDPGQDPWMNQYRSMIFPVTERQEELAEVAVRKARSRRDEAVLTQVLPIDSFHPDETYHQKYYLRKHRELWSEVTEVFGSEQAALRSTVAARLNAGLGGYADGAAVEVALEESSIDAAQAQKLREAVAAARRE